MVDYKIFAKPMREIERFPDRIEKFLFAVNRLLPKNDQLADSDIEAFSEILAEHYGELPDGYIIEK